VGGFVANSILTGFDSFLLARESNLDTIMGDYKILKNILTNKPQVRHFSRITFKNYVFPLKALIDYIALYLKYILLDDVLYGNIEPYSIQTARTYLDNLGNMFFSENFFAYVGNELEMYRQRIKELKDNLKNPILYKSPEGLKSIGEYVANLETELSNLNKAFDNMVTRYGEKINEFWRKLLDYEKYNIKDIIRDKGLVALREKIKELLGSKYKELAEQEKLFLEDLTENKIDSELRKTTSSLKDSVDKLIEDIKKFKATLSEKSYEKHGSIIDSFISIIFNKAESEISERGEELAEKINAVLIELEENTRKLNKLLLILSLQRFYQYISDIIKKVEKKITDIRYEISRLLTLEDYDYSAEPIYLKNNPPAEAMKFFEYIRKNINLDDFTKGKSIEQALENEFLNSDSYLYFYKYLPAKIDKFDEIINKDFERLLKKFQTKLRDKIENFGRLNLVVDFMKRETEKGDLNFAKDLQFWGSININCVEESAEIDRKDLKYIAIIFNSKDIKGDLVSFEKELKELIPSDAVNASITVMFSDENVEDVEIRIIGVHYGLPLCAFKDVEHLQNVYINLPYREKVLAHISEQFAYFDEPFGINPVSMEKIYYLLKLAYVLGAIRIENNTLKIYSSPPLSGQDIYEDVVIEGIRLSQIDSVDIYISDAGRLQLLEALQNAIINRYINIVYKNLKESNDDRIKEALKLLYVKSYLTPSESGKKIIPFPSEILEKLKNFIKDEMRIYTSNNLEVPQVYVLLYKELNNAIKEFNYMVFLRAFEELRKYNISDISKIYVTF